MCPAQCPVLTSCTLPCPSFRPCAPPCPALKSDTLCTLPWSCMRCLPIFTPVPYPSLRPCALLCPQALYTCPAIRPRALPCPQVLCPVLPSGLVPSHALMPRPSVLPQAWCLALPQAPCACPALRPCRILPLSLVHCLALRHRPRTKLLCSALSSGLVLSHAISPVSYSALKPCTLHFPKVSCPTALRRCALPCYQALWCPPSSGPVPFPVLMPLPVLTTCALFCPHALSLVLPSGPIPCLVIHSGLVPYLCPYILLCP